MTLGLVGSSMLTLAAGEEAPVSISITFGKDGPVSNGLNVANSGDADGVWEIVPLEVTTKDGKELSDYVANVTKYMYFKIDTSTDAGKKIKASPEATVRFEYYDVGTNNLLFQFNADPDNLISNTTNPRYDMLPLPKKGTNDLVWTDAPLSNCKFAGSQNAGGDFRVSENPMNDSGLYLKKVTVTLGVENALEFDPPEFKPQTETNNVIGTSMAGYQAWFTASEKTNAGWGHWNGGGRPEAGRLSVEMWPDVSDYLEAGATLYQTGFSDLGNGEKAQLFNSHDPEIIDTHFKWISEYGIGGFAVQRFYSATTASESSARNHLQTIAEKAEKYDKTFYVMYDLSGSGGLGEKALKQIQYDFIYNVERKGVVSSKAYGHADGKPVVCLWGLAYETPEEEEKNDRYPSAAVALDMVKWFQDRGYFVIGGIPQNNWVEEEGDYAKVFEALDMLSPWMVGRMNQADQLKNDSAWIEAHNTKDHTYYYQPVLYPGFAWSNLKGHEKDEPNAIAREAGQFLWTQALRAAGYKMDSIYFAMFDEYDEGTAYMKAASDSFDIPTGLQYFLTLSADGSWLSSDFYLRAAGAVTEMTRKVASGELAYEDVPAVVPVPHSLGPVYYRNGFEGRYATNGTLGKIDVGVARDFTWPEDRYVGNVEFSNLGSYHMNDLDSIVSDDYGLNVLSSTLQGDFAALFEGKVYTRDDDGNACPKLEMAIGFSHTKILVEKGLSFEYNVMPLNENGAYVYLDLLFSDGTALSDVQGGLVGRKAEIGKWTKVKVMLDDSLAGKTITDIMITYDHVPAEDGTFGTLVDNVMLEVEAQDAALLKELTDSAENTVADDYVAQYTGESVAAVKTAVAAAKKVLANEAATEAELKGAIADLAAAVKALETVDGLQGDINGDGEINTTDARLALQFAVNKITLNSAQQSAGDVNGDGVVNTTDARLILQFAVGKISSF